MRTPSQAPGGGGGGSRLQLPGEGSEPRGRAWSRHRLPSPSPTSPRFLPPEAPRPTQPCPGLPPRAVPCRARSPASGGCLRPSPAVPCRAVPPRPPPPAAAAGGGGPSPAALWSPGVAVAAAAHARGPKGVVGLVVRRSLTEQAPCCFCVRFVFVLPFFFFFFSFCQLSGVGNGVCVVLRGCHGCSFPQPGAGAPSSSLLVSSSHLQLPPRFSASLPLPSHAVFLRALFPARTPASCFPLLRAKPEGSPLY